MAIIAHVKGNACESQYARRHLPSGTPADSNRVHQDQLVTKKNTSIQNLGNVW